jgi:hypothetical protein
VPAVITTYLPVLSQAIDIDIDIESIAPSQDLTPDSCDVANMTISATGNALRRGHAASYLLLNIDKLRFGPKLGSSRTH